MSSPDLSGTTAGFRPLLPGAAETVSPDGATVAVVSAGGVPVLWSVLADGTLVETRLGWPAHTHARRGHSRRTVSRSQPGRRGRRGRDFHSLLAEHNRHVRGVSLSQRAETAEWSPYRFDCARAPIEATHADVFLSAFQLVLPAAALIAFMVGAHLEGVLVLVLAIVPTLISLFLRSTRHIDNEALQSAVRSDEPAPAWLVRELRTGHPDQRREAARLLARHPTPETVPALVERADSPDPILRSLVLRALAATGDARAVVPLVLALGRSRDRQMAGRLLVDLGRDDLRNRCYAAFAGEDGFSAGLYDQYREVFLRLTRLMLRDPAPGYRVEAARMAAAAGADVLLPDLERATRDIGGEAAGEIVACASELRSRASLPAPAGAPTATEKLPRAATDDVQTARLPRLVDIL